MASIALESVFQSLDDEVCTTAAIEEVTALLGSKTILPKIAYRSGTTATACVIGSDNNVTVANVGDSRCVLSLQRRAYALSYDHKPTEDREYFRIIQAGGIVIDGRIHPGVRLNMSRSIGDHAYKSDPVLPREEQIIVSCPEVQCTQLMDGDRFIVLVCDGISDVLTRQQVVDFINEKLDHIDLRKSGHSAVIHICQELCDRCVAKGYGENNWRDYDNVSVVIIVPQTLNSESTKSLHHVSNVL